MDSTKTYVFLSNFKQKCSHFLDKTEKMHRFYHKTCASNQSQKYTDFTTKPIHKQKRLILFSMRTKKGTTFLELQYQLITLRLV
jgi:flagellar motor switch protein FliM